MLNDDDRRTDLERWGKIINALKGSEHVHTLYHRPGLRRLIAVVPGDKIPVFYKQVEHLKVHKGEDVLILPHSPFINVTEIMAQGYREIGMQRLVLTSATLQFTLNYPGDLQGFSTHTDKATQLMTMIPMNGVIESPNKWYETRSKESILQQGTCLELDTYVNIGVSGDNYNKQININIAEK